MAVLEVSVSPIGQARYVSGFIDVFPVYRLLDRCTRTGTNRLALWPKSDLRSAVPAGTGPGEYRDRGTLPFGPPRAYRWIVRLYVDYVDFPHYMYVRSIRRRPAG